jgi:hypothetical protein
VLQRAQQAAPLRDIATAIRLGEESGSKLPHSTESRRGCVWSAAACRRFRGRSLAMRRGTQNPRMLPRPGILLRQGTRARALRKSQESRRDAGATKPLPSIRWSKGEHSDPVGVSTRSDLPTDATRPGFSGRSKQRHCGILQRQYVWVKKAGASSRTPQNRGEAAFGVRRLAAAFASAAPR